MGLRQYHLYGYTHMRDESGNFAIKNPPFKKSELKVFWGK
jgi:hypothetical protein